MKIININRIKLYTSKLCNFLKKACSLSHGKCQIIVDGFYIETLACTIYGVIWYCIFRKSIKNLQSKNVKEWHVVMKKT